MIIDAPFSIFQPFATQLRVQYYTQNDGKTLLSSPATDVTFLKQVHSNTVITIDEREDRIAADAAICTTKNLCLGVYFADCQNFVLYAPTVHVIGIIHAGAKGINANIIPEFFKRSAALNIPAQAWYIGGGPSLCVQCAEFTNPTEELPNIPPTYVHNRHVHLQRCAYDQFIAAGVPETHIEILPECTKCEYDTLYSYRGSDAVKQKRFNH